MYQGVESVNEDENVMKLLTILDEQYDKSPYYVGSSILRSKLDMPVDELRVYAESLYEEGYVDKLEGLAPTFILRMKRMGHEIFTQMDT